MKKILVLGCGNMVEALIPGIVSNLPQVEFIFYTPSKTRAEKLAKKLNQKYCESLDELDFNSIDSLFLGFKPQQLDIVTDSLKTYNLKNKTVISILAAIDLNTLGSKFNSDKVLRIMPNIASAVDMGVNLIAKSKHFNNNEFIEALELNSKCFLLSEEMLDKATIITGSGPALLYKFMQQLFDYLINIGIDDKSATEMISGTLNGSLKLFESNGLSLGEQISLVTSKGGVTERALETLDKDDFSGIVRHGLEQGTLRGVELRGQ